ncbi:MAG: hypothetical protein M9922_07150 [Microthrixaceae bacterium]|nr:hypothetical protein [Microthrixaceae bacterium]
MTDSQPLRRSEGLLLAPFNGGLCVYDLTDDSVHILGPAAARVMAALPTDIASLLSVAHEIAEPGTPDPSADVVAGIQTLAALGVVNRDRSYVPVGLVRGSIREHDGSHTGASHDVLDQVLAFRSHDRELLEQIDRFIGVNAEDKPPTVYFDAEPRSDGGIDLFAAEHWPFPTRRGFFVQLPGVIHDFAPRSCSEIVFHAGAVRISERRVILLAGATERGKSTLVAALVQAGCDYMGEEMTGVRAGTLNALCYPTPLALDRTSRELLGLVRSDSPNVDPRELNAEVVPLSGEVDPVREVILPVFNPEVDRSVERLGPIDALKALVENATNLGRAGDTGFATLCSMAEDIPVTRIVHGDSRALADSIMAGATTSATSSTDEVPVPPGAQRSATTPQRRMRP